MRVVWPGGKEAAAPREPSLVTPRSRTPSGCRAVLADTSSHLWEMVGSETENSVYPQPAVQPPPAPVQRDEGGFMGFRSNLLPVPKHLC